MGEESSAGHGRSVSVELALLLDILFTLSDDSWKKAYINGVSEIITGTSSPRQKYLLGYSHSPEPSMLPWGWERCELSRERSSCLLWQEKGIQSDGHKTRHIMHKIIWKRPRIRSIQVKKTQKQQNPTFIILPFKLAFTNYFKIFFFTAILLFLYNSHIFLLDNSCIKLFLFHGSFITFLSSNHQTAENLVSDGAFW